MIGVLSTFLFDKEASVINPELATEIWSYPNCSIVFLPGNVKFLPVLCLVIGLSACEVIAGYEKLAQICHIPGTPQHVFKLILTL
jgi:hypothetical protein